MRAAGRFFDGRSARSAPVVVALRPHGLALLGPGDALLAVWRADRLRLAEPWRRDGGPARFLHADDDARLVIEDVAAVEAILAQAPHLRGGRDSDLRPRLLAAIAAGAVLFCAAAYVVVDRAAPAMARALIGQEQARAWGDEVAGLLVGTDADAYCRSAPARAALDALTARLLKAIGAPADAVQVDIANVDRVNAFALPGGRVLLLRGLLDDAQTAEAVAGVLAHEIGHALERHPIEGFGRAMGAQLALTLIAPSGGLDLAGTATLLSYSRDAERAADDWALRMLRTADIDARPLGAFFRRIAGAGADTDPAEDGGGILTLLSTHPDAAQRARLFTSPGGEAMSKAAWRSLKTACADAPPGREPFRGVFGAGISPERSRN